MLEFFSLKNEAFGLDISDLSLKTVFLRKKKGFFELAAFGERKLKPGIVEDGEIKNEKKLAEIIKEAIKNPKRGKIQTKYVIVSLPEKKSFLEIIQMPKLREEELKSAILYEAENYIPLPVHEVYLDYQVIPPVYESSKKINILLAAIPKKIADSYLSTLKLAGLFPLAFEIESLAIARALIKNEIADSPVFLIDIGATKSIFVIFSGYSVRFSFSSPISSNTFTQAIAKNLNISFEKAEKIKIEQGLAEKFKVKLKEKDMIFEEMKGTIFEILVPPLVDFVQQIKKCLEYYKTHTENNYLVPTEKGISKILLSGGGANLKGLPFFLSLELKTPVQLADPLVNLRKDIKEIRDLPPSEFLKYTTAIGLALRGAEYD